MPMLTTHSYSFSQDMHSNGQYPFGVGRNFTFLWFIAHILFAAGSQLNWPRPGPVFLPFPVLCKCPGSEWIMLNLRSYCTIHHFIGILCAPCGPRCPSLKCPWHGWPHPLHSLEIFMGQDGWWWLVSDRSFNTKTLISYEVLSEVISEPHQPSWGMAVRSLFFVGCSGRNKIDRTSVRKISLRNNDTLSPKEM